MFKKIQKKRRIAGYATPAETRTATLSHEAGTSTLHVGATDVFISSSSAPTDKPANNDFAVFALCALSLSNNWAITVDFEVSESAVAQCSRIANTYRLWCIDVLAPLRLTFPKVVHDPAQSSGQGIICLSGGLDSMAAAVEAVADGQTSHALLVAGADYADAQDPGFVDLERRVRTIAEKLGLELCVVSTNLRRTGGIQWDMTHSFNLAFCLHYLSSRYGFGSFAQDNTIIQDLFRAPWGNAAVFADLFSTPAFPITTYGTHINRVEKLDTVLAYEPSLISDLSVCFADKTTGGNCGKCPKCLRLRIALEALGQDTGNGLFEAYPDLVTAVNGLKIPKRLSGIRGHICRTTELVDALPDGPVRDALLDHEAKLRARFHALMPATEKY